MRTDRQSTSDGDDWSNRFRAVNKLLTHFSAYHDGDQIPAKVIPSKQACYISHNGLEVFKPIFDLLSGTGFTWVGSSNGHVPDGAVLGGSQRTGEPLYVGRAHFEGSLTVGKIHPGHGCIYIPFGGQEHSITQYEVLVAQQRSEWDQKIFRSKANVSWLQLNGSIRRPTHLCRQIRFSSVTTPTAHRSMSAVAITMEINCRQRSFQAKTLLMVSFCWLCENVE